MPWSEWHRFSELQVHPVPATCTVGVYQIRAGTENRTAVVIPRACGVDSEGILYIGRGFLPDRVGRLLRISEQNPKPHHNFIPVFFGYDLERICSRKFVEIRWMPCDDFAAEEGRLLEDYKRRTGDIPPGNRKLEPFVVAKPTTDLEET